VPVGFIDGKISFDERIDGNGNTGIGCETRLRAPPGRAPLRRPRLPAGIKDDREEHKMADHTYSISEIVGTSSESIDSAIKNGIATAKQTLRHLDWFEVKEIRGHLNEGDVADWQVTIKLGFRLER
jgi:flavin-binding protein dodecin